MINIEARLVAFLRYELDVPVDADVPANKPERFVSLERVGGERDTFRDLPRVAIQAWAVTRYGASELASDVADALERFKFEPGIARVEVGSTINFPDPESNKPRYQVTATFVTKG